MRLNVSRVLNPPELVGALILPGVEWDRATIVEVFLPTYIEDILSIPLCTRHIDDSWS
jgi:hypothetical protein